VRLRPENSSLARWLVLPFALAGGAGLVAVRWRPDLVLRAAHCPWRDVTGIACPTCGGTHAAAVLATGDVAGAWRANPAVPLGALVLTAWILWAVLAAAVPAWRVQLELSAGEKKAARWGAALFFVALWVRQVMVL